jgi:hypothetical protein
MSSATLTKATESGPSIVTDTHYQHHPRMQRRMTLEEEHGGEYFLQPQSRAAPAPTQLEHNCALNIDKPPYLVRKTGIICTIGECAHLKKVKDCLRRSCVCVDRNADRHDHGRHEYCAFKL